MQADGVSAKNCGRAANHRRYIKLKLLFIHPFRKTIWLGFFSALMMSVIFIIVDKLPPAAGWNQQAAFDAILGLTPRIVCASLIAYFFGEFSNSFVLAKMKIFTKGNWLWTRTIGSTVVG